jgi:hypothetical protein
MAKAGQLPGTVTASVLSLIIGGVIGFYAQAFNPHAAARGQAPAAMSAGAGMQPGAGMRPGPGGGGFGGFGGGGFGGGFGGAPSPSMDLARTVRNLNTIESVQGRGLTHAQATALAPILRKIKSAPKLSDDEAKKDADAIDKVLTSDQHEALTSLQPQRGGWGGGRRGGPGGGAEGGPGASPFATDRNKEALDHLIAATNKA